jgi:hypothetical protein
MPSHKTKQFARHSSGYIKIISKNHPNKDGQNYVFEHRLIYEHYLSIMFDEQIYLPKHMDIHHINGIKNDNRLINLQLVTKKEHRILHNKDHSKTFCILCNSKTTYIRGNGRPRWSIYENGYICRKCETKEYINKKELK